MILRWFVVSLPKQGESAKPDAAISANVKELWYGG